MKQFYWKRMALAGAEVVAPVATNLEDGLLAYLEKGMHMQPGEEVRSAKVNGRTVYAVKMYTKSGKTVTKFIVAEK